MRKREEIATKLNEFSGKEEGIQQQVVAAVLMVELLLDIRDLLSAQENNQQ